MDNEKCQLIAHQCIHAAWILIVNRQVNRAEELIMLSSKFGLFACSNYVSSSISRGKGDFEQALKEGLNAAKSFKHPYLIAQAYNQVGLASLRLGKLENSMKQFEEALVYANKVNDQSANDYAYQLIMSSEGSVKERTVMNLAQVYNKLGKYEKALSCFDDMPKENLLQESLAIAYRQTILAEAHIGLHQYEKANELLNNSYQRYKDQNAFETPNCLRALLGLLEIELQLGNELTLLQEATSLHSKILGSDKPTHDFSIRLKGITETMEKKLSIGL